MKISNKKLFTCAVLCVGMVAGILITCNRNIKQDVSINVVGTFFEPALLQLSTDMKNLVFSPAEEYKIEKDDRSRYRHRNVYIFDMTTKKPQKVIDNSDISWLAWQPCSNKYTLWISQMESYGWFLSWPRYKLLQIDADKNKNWQIVRTNINPEIISTFYWNPNGDILVGKPRKDFTPSEDSINGNIAVSWNEGQNAIYYKGIQCLKIYWIDENTFITQDNNKKTIHKFLIGDHQLSSVQTFQYGKDATLFGVYDGKPVYRLKGNIYIEDKLFYNSEEGVDGVRVKKPYVYFKEKLSIIILNTESQNKLRITIPNDNIFLIGLDPDKGEVYWLSDRKEIYGWNYKNEQSKIELYLKIAGIE
jgi:hypothetical protein